MRKHVKVKLSLLGTIGVSLLAVSSAAVSTFAWFQAKSQVNVSTSSADPVQITVSAPEALPIITKLYAYKNNGTYGHKESSNLNITDFVEQQSLSPNSEHIWPGRKMSYALKIESTSVMPQLIVSVSGLDTKKSSDTNRTILEEKNSEITETTKYIDVQKTIQMTGKVVSDNYVDQASLSAGKVNNVGSSHIALNENWNLAGQTGNVRYFFFNIEFVDTTSNFASYPKYVEYKKTGDGDSATYTKLTTYEAASSTDSKRYFLPVTSGGNSNCYAGLSVGLTGIKIQVA